MPDETRSEQLLAEILTTQREHLAEYRRVTAEFRDLQRQAVETQVRHVALYKRLAIAGGVVVLALLALLLWLIVRIF